MASRQVPQATIVQQSHPSPFTTSSGQHLLMPNRAPQSRKEQTILVEVSSRDRNYLQRVASNPIRFQFARPLKDVRQVELISGTIPAKPYNIVDGANCFTFQEGDPNGKNTCNEWVICIPPGHYTELTFLQKLNQLFCRLCGLNVYCWTIDCETNTLILTRTAGDAPFAFLFFSGANTADEIDRSDGQFLKQNTPALQMGFDLADYHNKDCYIASPFPIDLCSSINRLYLYVNLENSKDLGIIERGAGRRWPFAIIYLDDETCGYKYLNKDTLTPVSFSLPQPIARLNTMEIDFRDEWYRPVNFNGKDFSLLLNFTVLE